MIERAFPVYAAIALTLVLTAGVSRHRAHAADTGAALSAIADTADRICGIVTTQGEASTAKAGGEVQAELDGLAKRLASLGVSVTGDITSSKYQGVFQQDLPNTLKDARECKLHVLDKLQAVVLPAGSFQSNGLGVPSASLLQSPSSATLIDTVKSISRQEDLGLYSCSTSQSAITCYITVTRSAFGQQDYKVEAITQQTKLVDNLHVEHRLHRAYFIDGIGGHVAGTNLSTGESIWLALEFDVGQRAASSARVVFNSYGNSQLSGPVS